MNPQSLYLLHKVMVGINLFGVGSWLLAFMFLALFGGALDLIGDYPGFNETFVILLFSIPLTLIAYVTHRKLKNRILSIGLLIPTTILNAVLLVQVTLVWYKLGPWLMMLLSNL